MGPSQHDFHTQGILSLSSQPQWAQWCELLRRQSADAAKADRHGLLTTWQKTLENLPDVKSERIFFDTDAVTVKGRIDSEQRDQLESGLRTLHPWRKGPYDLFGIHIDTEWRSDWKWNRIRDVVELKERLVLDVGCGNGYFGWRMLGAGARGVIGLDPFLLYVAQHEAIRRYAGPSAHNHVFPVSDACLNARLNVFDVTFSMGVLYHRTSPIEHLQLLYESLRQGGTLVLETLIIESNTSQVLVPEGRYAQMRNVWFIPSVAMLQIWLKRTGFRNVDIVDISPTTTDEQRSTGWMTFHSLSDFLDPNDPQRTVEGYPAPVRAMLTAVR